MEMLWFAILVGMLATYVVLDGFDFGAGMLHVFVARTEDERRSVFGAAGPVWDGNEVWLIASGGTLFMTFPTAYAAGFSGFYLPLMMLLWALVLRGLSIEFRSHDRNPLWRTFWDGTFALGSTFIGLLLGAALGNVLRGVPLDASGSFRMPLFDAFLPGPRSGVLDGYSLLVSAFTGLALAGHGGLFLAWKTEQALHRRCLLAARIAYVLAAGLLPFVTAATLRVAPELGSAAARRPAVWALAAAVAFSAGGLAWNLVRARVRSAFFASGALLFALLGTGAAARWPVLLRSTLDARWSLDAHAAATSTHGLRVALAWTCLGLPLACGYVVFVMRSFRGKVRLEPEEH